MRAYSIESFGHAGLALGEHEAPRAGHGELVLQMLAASLNYRDLLMLKGKYDPRQKLPLIPLSDGVGRVIAIGEGVDGFSIGERVCPIFAQEWLAGEPTKARLRSTLGGPRHGTLCEQMRVPAGAVVRIPDSIPDAEAATLPCAGVTAYNALVTLGQLRGGDTVLVQGSGGVSVFALQIAKAMGATVIATTSSDEKAARLSELGADHVINYRTETRWGTKARSLAPGDGVDHVVEVGGSGTLEESLRAVRSGGHVAVIGILSGGKGEISLLPMLMNQVRLQGVMVGARETFEQFVRCVVANRIQPVVDEIMDFDAAPAAFKKLESGKHFGKVVIRIGA
ncbi:MAG: NAD(P)-dependent alcohol dehydrogenase [Polyangiaceae bacterium]|nr:NAD(P)-dependent alcohol dehydrogenase [Myxococcales bacterium]MCB9588614.1 NAD(P)-dependent alcohol dehydrogenase [Polyangiaceae bacterium]MCB9610443.1 NAD(P)-dependent alcohol dehydrogenase [Polyangiaceae bacterium]